MNIKFKITQIFIAFCCVLLSACSSTPKQPGLTPEQMRQKIEDHVIRINHDGLVIPAVEPSNELISYFTKTPVSENEFAKQFDHLLCMAECFAWHKDNNTVEDKDNCSLSNKQINTPVNKVCSTPSKKTKVKLLIHVHGGLNFFMDTYDRVLEVAPIIKDDNTDWHYPIFISWPSSPFGTYGEHLTSIRSGKKAETFTGIMTTPFVLLTDLMQIGNIVSSVYRQSQRVITEIAYNTGLGGDSEPEAWALAKSNYDAVSLNQQCTGYPKVYWSQYYYPETWSGAFFEDYIGRHTAKSLTYPIRSTLGTIYNGAIVQSAWRNMKRRTKNFVYPPELFDASKDMMHVEGGRFFELLLDRVSNNKAHYDYEITLVGHSMGTMVLNHVFKKYREDWIATDGLKNIVYMAAADSVQNTMDSVFPIISQINTKPGQSVTFYNLTLNRLAEISETTLMSVLPNGSLLINIDEHLENPETLLDRTIGQETNVLAVIPVIKERLGDAVAFAQFKSFDRYQDYGPDKHGSFNEMPFWRKQFWSVGTKTKHKLEGVDCRFNGYRKDWLAHE